MGSNELNENCRHLKQLCETMGLMDHFEDLRNVVMDEQHLRDQLVGVSPSFRNNNCGVFVSQEWIRQHVKRIGRGPQPESGLFDQLD